MWELNTTQSTYFYSLITRFLDESEFLLFCCCCCETADCDLFELNKDNYQDDDDAAYVKMIIDSNKVRRTRQ